MSKINFALLGCGRIVSKHVDALTKLKESNISAVCDVDIKKARTYGLKLNIPYYTDYNMMLEKEKIDVVNVLTPSGLHATHVVDIASNYKKHIVCEKPMSLNIIDADKMINACNESNVKLFIVKQNRYNIPILLLRKIIDKESLGNLILGTVRLRWTRHQSYYDMDSWRGTRKMDGGCITNQGCHFIDLLQWIMGPVVEISALTDTRLLDIETEDTGVSILKFQNGALGIIEVTTAVRPESIEASLSILGEKGSIEIAGLSANKVKYWNIQDQTKEEKAILESSFNENPPNVYGFGHIRYLEHVIDCIKNEKKPIVDGIEGRKTIEIIDAIYKSANTGKKIFIDPRSS